MILYVFKAATNAKLFLSVTAISKYFGEMSQYLMDLLNPFYL